METRDGGEEIKLMIEKLKKMVRDGNVDRIQIRKGDEVVLNIPVNVGLLGGLIGLAAAPWAMIAGTIAAFGLGCRIEVIHKDGTTDEVMTDEASTDEVWQSDDINESDEVWQSDDTNESDEVWQSDDTDES